MGILEQKIPVTTTGSAGSATGSGNADIALTGLLLGFRVKYNASAPATTDVTITSDLPTGYPAHTLLTVSNNNTDIPYRPIQQEVYTSANTNTGLYTLIPLQGHNITVSVAGADELDPAVTVYVVYTKV